MFYNYVPKVERWLNLLSVNTRNVYNFVFDSFVNSVAVFIHISSHMVLC